MEQILHLYQLPYDSNRPLVCLDERPCVLHEQILAPMAMKPNSPKKIDNEYKRAGTCCLFAGLEPLRGFRITRVRERRTKREYTEFMQDLAQQYPQAEKILIIQDNLNTHSKGAFYENLPADKAFGLAQRFEFFYTPKKASWLNMVEIELSAIARMCLHRRIDKIETLRNEVNALIKERNENSVKVNWQFSKQNARDKLKRHYGNVYSNI